MKTIVLCPNVKRDTELEYSRRLKEMLETAGYRVLVSPVYGHAEQMEETPLAQALDKLFLQRHAGVPPSRSRSAAICCPIGQLCA